MANRHEIHLQVVILFSCFLALECVTSLTCGTSVTTITLNLSLETFRYPASGRYPKTTTCEWLFESPDTEARLMYEVTNIYVDSGDTLKFNDGSKVFCISSCGGSQPSKTTTGNTLSVKLMTDGTENPHETGFTVFIVVGKDESNCSNSDTVHNIALAEQTKLTSPNFPANYPLNHLCTYTYTYTGGNVKFEFIYLRVEIFNGECYDYVEIFNGSSINSPLIAKVCGNTVPSEMYTSSGTSLTIRFTSDYIETRQGFLAFLTPVAKSTTSIVRDSTTTKSILLTMEPNQTSILPTMEPSHTTISPTMEPSQTTISPTMEPRQTSISPTMAPSKTTILTTMKSSQTSISPTMEPSHTTISPKMEPRQTSISPTMAPSKTTILTTMEPSHTTISPTMEPRQTSISPTMAPSKTTILTIMKSSQTSISPTMEPSQTLISSTTKPRQTSTSPTMEPSQTSISSTMESSQSAILPITKSNLASTPDSVLQMLDIYKGPLIGGGVVLLLAITTIFVFILSKYRTSQNKTNVKNKRRDDPGSVYYMVDEAQMMSDQSDYTTLQNKTIENNDRRDDLSGVYCSVDETKMIPDFM